MRSRLSTNIQTMWNFSDSDEISPRKSETKIVFDTFLYN